MRSGRWIVKKQRFRQIFRKPFLSRLVPKIDNYDGSVYN